MASSLIDQYLYWNRNEISDVDLYSILDLDNQTIK